MKSETNIEEVKIPEGYIQCPKCKSVINSKLVFCTKCGKELSKDTNKLYVLKTRLKMLVPILFIMVFPIFLIIIGFILEKLMIFLKLA